MLATFTPGATPGDADAVAGRGDLAGHMRAVVVVPRCTGRQAPCVVSATPPTQFADCEAEKFGAMSGWVSSTPVSMTATVTLLAARVDLGGLVGADRPQVPLVGLERLLARVAGRLRDLRGLRRGEDWTAPSSVVPAAVSGGVRVAPADWTPRTVRIRRAEVGVRRVDDEHADLVVRRDDAAAGRGDRLLRPTRSCDGPPWC